MVPLSFKNGESELPVLNSVNAGEKIGVDPMALPALQAVGALIDGNAVPPIHTLAFIQIPSGAFLQIVELTLINLFEQALFKRVTVLAIQQRVYVRDVDFQGLRNFPVEG